MAARLIHADELEFSHYSSSDFFCWRFELQFLAILSVDSRYENEYRLTNMIDELCAIHFWSTDYNPSNNSSILQILFDIQRLLDAQ